MEEKNISVESLEGGAPPPTEDDLDLAAQQIAEDWMEHLGPFLIGKPAGAARESLIELAASGMAQRHLMDERLAELAEEVRENFYQLEERDID